MQFFFSLPSISNHSDGGCCKKAAVNSTVDIARLLLMAPFRELTQIHWPFCRIRNSPFCLRSPTSRLFYKHLMYSMHIHLLKYVRVEFDRQTQYILSHSFYALSMFAHSRHHLHIEWVWVRSKWSAKRQEIFTGHKRCFFFLSNTGSDIMSSRNSDNNVLRERIRIPSYLRTTWGNEWHLLQSSLRHSASVESFSRLNK